MQVWWQTLVSDEEDKSLPYILEFNREFVRAWCHVVFLHKLISVRQRLNDLSFWLRWLMNDYFQRFCDDFDRCTDFLSTPRAIENSAHRLIMNLFILLYRPILLYYFIEFGCSVDSRGRWRRTFALKIRTSTYEHNGKWSGRLTPWTAVGQETTTTTMTTTTTAQSMEHQRTPPSPQTNYRRWKTTPEWNCRSYS